jgi:phage-related protein
MPTWPSSLPDKPLQQGYEEAPGDGRQRTQMDTGPAKVRRRFTATVDEFTARFHLTSTEVDTLDSFWENDLDGGTLRFDWTHPRTGLALQFRFVNRPKRRVVGGTLYEVTARLEVLP